MDTVSMKEVWGPNKATTIIFPVIAGQRYKVETSCSNDHANPLVNFVGLSMFAFAEEDDGEGDNFYDDEDMDDLDDWEEEDEDDVISDEDHTLSTGRFRITRSKRSAYVKKLVSTDGTIVSLTVVVDISLNASHNNLAMRIVRKDGSELVKIRLAGYGELSGSGRQTHQFELSDAEIDSLNSAGGLHAGWRIDVKRKARVKKSGRIHNATLSFSYY